jgi:succinate-semialdehyde dehydrogenase / glutarate-semialdehyde dehydrogenase
VELQTSMYTDGRWVSSLSDAHHNVINPANEEVIASVAYGGADDMNRALEAASRALPVWSKMTAYERGKLLRRAAELLEQNAEEIAHLITLEQGRPLADTRGEPRGAASFFDWFAEEAKRLYGRIVPAAVGSKRHFVIHHPIGVCGFITPWNFPVILPARKMAAALAAGCTFVIRPADETPLSLIKVFECLHQAGIPAGVANLVMGDGPEQGKELLNNPICRKVSFTGSVAVGKELMRGAADQLKRISLELGGHAPFIVFEDADIEAAAQFAVTHKFRNNGQVCICPSRFYVSRELESRFTELCVHQAKKLKMGDGFEPDVQVGPMQSPKMLNRAELILEDAVHKGAGVLCGGGRPKDRKRGYFFEPTVVNRVDHGMLLMQEEPFSPILPVAAFDEVGDVIRHANGTAYGLAAYVFTHDIRTIMRVAEELEFGIIGINDATPATAQCPFGGMKSSGIGREGGQEGLMEYVETKYVSVAI